MRPAARQRDNAPLRPTAGGRAPWHPAQPDAAPTALLQLQRQAGNRAVCELLARRRGQVVQRDPIRDAAAVTGLAGGLAAGFATTLLSLLRGADLDQAAVRGLVRMGVREEGDLTNLIFWARHPEAALRKIQPGETDLAADWVRIRDSLVRPALSASPQPDQPGGATTDRPGGRPAAPSEAVEIGPENLGSYGDEDATRFREEVYTEQLERTRRRKEYFPGLPATDLDVVEGGHQLHRDAAGDARSLLAAARADLAAEQDAGDPGAIKVISIGIGSAYRDPQRDFSAWKNAFNTHYNATADARAALPGGAYGPAAVDLMVARMVKKKAIPGFSNHTKGLAIDFTTTQGKWTFGASSAQSAGWVRTWLYLWLTAHAAAYHFEPYSEEPWHWDHST